MTDIEELAGKLTEADVLLFPNIIGRCIRCRTDAYTLRELNLHEGQDGRCYSCFDKARYGERYGTVSLTALRTYLQEQGG